MNRAALLLLLTAVAAAGGCSRGDHSAAAPPPVHLSTSNPDANAGPIAQFVRAACIEAIGDTGAIEQAIAATRWPVEDAPGSAGQMVTVRDFEHGRIAYSAIPFEAPGSRFRDCQIELDGAVAPSLDRMRAALAALVPASPLPAARDAQGEIRWRWQPDPMQERELGLAAQAPGQGGGRAGLSIHVSSTEYTLPPHGAAPANAIDDDDLNAVAPAPAGTGSTDDATPPDAPDAAPDAAAPTGGRWSNSAAPR